MTSGLLIRGHLVEVPGLTITPPYSHGGPAWARLDPRDYRMRRQRVRQLLIHSTKGDEPQHVVPGAGPGGHARATAEFWSHDPTPSGAPLVVDNNGTVACLCDLVYHEAYHGTVSNPYSAGVEMAQEADNGIHEAVYDAMVKLVPALCDLLEIPYYVVADPYTGHPLPRFLDGAPGFAGVLGHRCNTEQRGRGDPGDEIFARLIATGGEPVLAQQYEDHQRSKARQVWLNARGGHLAVDGEAGPASFAEMRRQGYGRWIDVPTESGRPPV